MRSTNSGFLSGG